MLAPGRSIHEYLPTRRVKRACELLRGSNSVAAENTRQAGFADSQYVITCFKKMMGQTPLAYHMSGRHACNRPVGALPSGVRR
ncbi:helix-turn-helix domain-containing protein [Candidatus Sodalis endolongispinus]|uniref:Helix-turn-helix domain-containing protein n=1 Tax=Candidatus Sodalis endolongispinus TaxID=2812662 RepID=A0ABS5Y8Q2_9GAMM|nr:helix-turn-helix domain-containing protein [Candidatus Sodalis endolongispinus]MBT9431382.1 helix-turn-helix domain-containing protein [Candidatus Sodalis endolongispinus]